MSLVLLIGYADSSRESDPHLLYIGQDASRGRELMLPDQIPAGIARAELYRAPAYINRRNYEVPEGVEFQGVSFGSATLESTDLDLSNFEAIDLGEGLTIYVPKDKADDFRKMVDGSAAQGHKIESLELKLNVADLDEVVKLVEGLTAERDGFQSRLRECEAASTAQALQLGTTQGDLDQARLEITALKAKIPPETLTLQGDDAGDSKPAEDSKADTTTPPKPAAGKGGAKSS